jgi:hypothetical protein
MMDNHNNDSYSHDDHTLVVNSDNGTHEDLHVEKTYEVFDVSTPKTKIEEKVFKT